MPPTAVRDLYGTVQDAGAHKGALVTTSRFGPGAHTFANGKPRALVVGSELVGLLHRHGLRGRLGSGDGGDGGDGPVPAQRTAPDSETGSGSRSSRSENDRGNDSRTSTGEGANDDHNVLGRPRR